MELNKPNIDIKWYRTKLPKEELAALNQRSDVRGLVQSLGYLGVLVATGVVTFYFWSAGQWWWCAFGLFLHGTVASFYINAVHELVHGTVFKTKWLNAFFAALFAWIGKSNYPMFWYSHSEHHKYTLHPPDDLEVVVPVYHSARKYFLSMLVSPQFYMDYQTNLRYCFGKFKGDWEPVLVPEDAPHRRRRVVNWARFLILSHIVVAAVSLYFGLWIIPLLVTFAGAYGGWLFYLCNYTQHSGLTENVDDFRLNCRTVRMHPIVRFLYWHMNWHIEHHMYAAVPCYNLKRLHRAIKHELPHTNGSIFEAWVEIFYIQYRRLRDDDYRFLAELPGEDGEFASNKSRLQQIREQADQRLEEAKRRKKSGGKRWECSVCAFVYDEARGLPEEGIAPGTRWQDIPDDWVCPDCGVSKAEFDMVEIPVDKVIAEEQYDIEVMANGVEMKPVVILGGGMAGYGVAKVYREHDKQREVILVTEDAGDHYSKPKLSNSLSASRDVEDIRTSTAAEMAEHLGIRVVANAEVSEIDRDKKVVVSSEGEFRYGDLVLAVGAEPIRIPFAGSGAEEVLSVNHLDDYAVLKKRLEGVEQVLIIGNGLIGCEFADDLTSAGFKVHVVGIGETPLDTLAPAEVGAALQHALANKGVSWNLGCTVESIDQHEGGYRCKLTNGEEVQVGLVLSAVGLKPRTELAEKAGLEVNRGIQVDATLRTNDPEIFAVGDCAEVEGKVLPYIAPMNIATQALVYNLKGVTTEVSYPVMPVVVKTPALPLVVCPPGKEAEGSWQVETEGSNVTARFVSSAGDLLGFALSGDSVKKRTGFVSEMNQDEKVE